LLFGIAVLLCGGWELGCTEFSLFQARAGAYLRDGAAG
jgi:hypothetical protein